MNKQDLKVLKSNVDDLIAEGDYVAAAEKVEDAVSLLHRSQKYGQVVSLYDTYFDRMGELMIWFEVAYALAERQREAEAESIYECLAKNSRESAVFNNLALIKEGKGDLDKAFTLIKKAVKFSVGDKTEGRNLERIRSAREERRQVASDFSKATLLLERENNFVLSKLEAFLVSARKDPAYSNGVVAIPSWKFKVFMGTDEQIADSLRQQWLDKNYIRDTGERGNYNERVYELNPYLEPKLEDIRQTIVEQPWVDALSAITPSELKEIGYYDLMKKIRRVSRRFRGILERDLDELTFNFLVGNKKSTIIMAGSFVEDLLTYHCTKKRISVLHFAGRKDEGGKKLHDCVLSDLLRYYDEKQILPSIVVHMGSVSRYLRNYVHVGKEIRESATLDQGLSSICFRSAYEIAKAIL